MALLCPRMRYGESAKNGKVTTVTLYNKGDTLMIVRDIRHSPNTSLFTVLNLEQIVNCQEFSDKSVDETSQTLGRIQNALCKMLSGSIAGFNLSILRIPPQGNTEHQLQRQQQREDCQQRAKAQGHCSGNGNGSDGGNGDDGGNGCGGSGDNDAKSGQQRCGCCVSLICERVYIYIYLL
jgi:hypothetical protein